MSTDVIGVVGMGNIGGGLANHLAGAFDVVGFDPQVPPGVTASGVHALADVAAVARAADVVCLSLPSSAASKQVVADLVAASDRRVGLIIEMSTVGEQTVRECAQVAEAADILYLDAPISGGPAGSRAGLLTAMVAGAPAARRRAHGVLDRACSQVIEMGDTAGFGQIVKIVNNVINSTSIAITSEAVAFATSRGLDLERVLDVLNSSSGRTQASEVKFPQTVVTGTFHFGSDNRIVAKDMELYRRAALASGGPQLVADRTIEIWQTFARESPGADTMEIYPYIEAKVQGGLA